MSSGERLGGRSHVRTKREFESMWTQATPHLKPPEAEEAERTLPQNL
jgi:hypothetical protein